MKNSKLWGITGILLVFGLIFIGCPTDKTDDPPVPGDITWTLEQKGGALGDDEVPTADTTHIVVKFSGAVDNFPTQRVTVSGAATKSNAPAKGSGNDWEIPVTISGSGTATVALSGFTAGVVKNDTKTVVVYKQGEPVPITYTVAANGTANTVSSTAITITFDKAVTGLLETEITLTGAAAEKAVGFSGSGTTWTLPIIAKSEGNITVTITHTGIEPYGQTVAIHYKAPSEAEDYNISVLAITTGDDDNPTAGKIIGTDFNKIFDANYGSYLRITVDTSAHSNPSAGPGWGIGAVGNLTNDAGDFDGSLNKGFNWPPAGTAYADVSLTDIRDYMANTDNFLYVNIWNDCTIVKVELYGKKIADLPPVLGTGVIRLIGVPSGESNPGKGTIGYIDYLKIMERADNYVLKIYGTGAGGIGTIGGTWVGADCASITFAGGVFKITVGQLKALGTAGDTDIATQKKIIINVWDDGAITKIELCVPPSLQTPITVYDLNDGSFMSGASLGTGGIAELDALGIKISPEASTTDYEGYIEFASDIDITGYTQITIEWNGVYTTGEGLNMFGVQLGVLFSDGKKVTHDLTVNASPQTFEFGSTAVAWDQTWADVDTTKCNGFRIYSNYQQKKDGYVQLTDDEVGDLFITRIVLE